MLIVLSIYKMDNDFSNTSASRENPIEDVSLQRAALNMQNPIEDEECNAMKTWNAKSNKHEAMVDVAVLSGRPHGNLAP